MLMVQSPYNVMKMDNVSVNQDSPVSLAMNACLDLKGTSVTNVLQIFMDTRIVKPVNATMRDQRTKHVTRKASVLAMIMWMETNVLHAVKVSTNFHNVLVREKLNY